MLDAVKNLDNISANDAITIQIACARAVLFGHITDLRPMRVMHKKTSDAESFQGVRPSVV